LQLQHHRGQPPRGHRLAVKLPGDVEVLAEHAPQVAAGEEDRARAVLAAQAILLTEMREMRGDDRLPADRAQAALIGEPVDLAQPRANPAPVRPEQPERQLGAGGDLPSARAQVEEMRASGFEH